MDKLNVRRPVYFNLNDPRELELNEWIDSKFTSFGGLVKDLLYLQMQQEKGLIQRTIVKTVVVPKKEEEMTESDYIDKSDVEDIEC